MRRQQHSLISFNTAFAAIAVASVSTAHGQVADDSGGAALEEVVVTAERREVSLQDVPASATVLSAAALAAQGVKSVIDIQQVAPSVSINTYNRSTFINIRGVGI